MADLTIARKLRFSDAAYAMDATPKTLRNWLERGLVKLHSPAKEGGGWAEYGPIDIAILALVRTFVNFGVDVPTASGLANTAMTKFFPEMLNLKDPESMPAGVMAVLWENARLYVWPEGDTWRLQYVVLWESGLHPARNEGFDPSLPSGIATLRREHEPAPAFIAIDVVTVLRTAFERAAESANKGRAVAEPAEKPPAPPRSENESAADRAYEAIQEMCGREKRETKH